MLSGFSEREAYSRSSNIRRYFSGDKFLLFDKSSFQIFIDILGFSDSSAFPLIFVRKCINIGALLINIYRLSYEI